MIEEIETPTYAWGDLCLKFIDEEQATAVLEGYEGSIDVIGIIYKPTGVVVAMDGEDNPIMAAETGWHVNVRGPVLPQLEEYAIEVATPMRVWA